MDGLAKHGVHPHTVLWASMVCMSIAKGTQRKRKERVEVRFNSEVKQ
jgi:hypothetical protein